MLRSKQYAGGWPSILNGSAALLGERALGRGVRALLKMNQPEGFDCPGCAWPEEAGNSRFEFCENGMKAAAAEATSKAIDRSFFERYKVSELKEKSDYWLEQQGRLLEPMFYDGVSDTYVPIDWDGAFRLVADELQTLGNPNQAAFYTSGRTSNEAAFLYQLFAREFGTNNLPDCSNMCHESSGVAMTDSIGVGKGTVLLDDFKKTDLILILGQNPGTNHPRMLASLEKARENGARIVTFNPIVETGLKKFIHPQNFKAVLTGQKTVLSTHYYQPLIGGDHALLKGVIKGILELDAKTGGVIDTDFIKEHTLGFEEFKRDAEAEDWASIEKESGLTRSDLNEVAKIYVDSRSVIACWAMGLTQHTNAVATIQTIINLLLLRGNIGRAGAGPCPVRGHSNVQGDRTVGITEKPTEEFLDRLDSAFGIKSPRQHGADVVETIHKMSQGEIKVFFGMGGNFAAATPDTEFTERALSNCSLTAHVSTKLNRSHLITGQKALILPCLGRSERDLQNGVPQKITVEDSMSMVHASQGRNAPAGPKLLSEPAIVAGLARAVLPESKVPWEGLRRDYNLIRSKISEVVGSFADFNVRIQQPGGFHLGNPARERVWNTRESKAIFKTHPLEEMKFAEDEIRLMTIRSHDQYNTTIYGLDDRYRGIRGERDVLFLNAGDMKSRGIGEGKRVMVTSRDSHGALRKSSRFKAVTYRIPKGMAAAYFPEANILVSIHSVAKRSNTPVSKLIPIRVAPLSS